MQSHSLLSARADSLGRGRRSLPRVATVAALTLLCALAFAALGAAPAAAECDEIKFRLWQDGDSRWFHHGDVIDVVSGREYDLYVHAMGRSTTPNSTRSDIGYPDEYGITGPASREVLRHIRMRTQEQDGIDAGRIRFKAQSPGTTELGYKVLEVDGRGRGRGRTVGKDCAMGTVSLRVVSSESELRSTGAADAADLRGPRANTGSNGNAYGGTGYDNSGHSGSGHDTSDSSHGSHTHTHSHGNDTHSHLHDHDHDPDHHGGDSDVSVGTTYTGGNDASSQSARALVETLYVAFLRRDEPGEVFPNYVEQVRRNGRVGLLRVAEEVVASEEFRRDAMARVQAERGRAGSMAQLRSALLDEIYRDLYGYGTPSRDDRSDDLDDLERCLSTDRSARTNCRELGRRLVGDRPFYERHQRMIDSLGVGPRSASPWRR